MNKQTVARAAAFAAALFLSAVPLAHPEVQQPDKRPQQQPDKKGQQKPPDEPGGLTIGTDLVLLDVIVIDRENKPVMDLRQDYFQVYEDRVQQKIEFFTREQAPVSLVLAIDTSRSMLTKLDTVIKASTSLARASIKGDELAIIEFKERAELIEEFTTDIESVVETLQNLVASRQTAMLDALYLGADYASKDGKNRKKAIVLVTDGLDRDSFYRLDDVVNHLRESDVQVYLVGFTTDLSSESSWFNKSEREKAEKLLHKLADETGGRSFFPRELSELSSITEQISTDLRQQYTIGYYPSNTNKDGTYRSIKVQMNSGDRKLVARHRSGYTAPREGPQPRSSK